MSSLGPSKPTEPGDATDVTWLSIQVNKLKCMFVKTAFMA